MICRRSYGVDAAARYDDGGLSRLFFERLAQRGVRLKSCAEKLSSNTKISGFLTTRGNRQALLCPTERLCRLRDLGFELIGLLFDKDGAWRSVPRFQLLLGSVLAPVAQIARMVPECRMPFCGT
jgi:hypothetical protein